MEIIAYQFSQLAAAILLGFFLGLYYDIYAFFVSPGKINRKLLGLLDFLWWALAFLWLFFLWYGILLWPVRLIFLFWLAFGFCLYWLLLHPAFNSLKAIFSRGGNSPIRRKEVSSRHFYLIKPPLNTEDLFFKPACFFWRGWNFSRKGFDYTFKSSGEVLKRAFSLGRFLFPKRRGKDDDEEYIDNH